MGTFIYFLRTYLEVFRHSAHSSKLMMHNLKVTNGIIQLEADHLTI